MADLAEIEALFFALVRGSAGAEGVFLNQDLAIRAASVLRDLHAHFPGAFSLCLLDLVDDREIACGRSNSTRICSRVSGRPLIHRVAPGPE
jgi:hypothetical protein